LHGNENRPFFAPLIPRGSVRIAPSLGAWPVPLEAWGGLAYCSAYEIQFNFTEFFSVDCQGAQSDSDCDKGGRHRQTDRGGHFYSTRSLHGLHGVHAADTAHCSTALV
jgi:hypothetical protein